MAIPLRCNEHRLTFADAAERNRHFSNVSIHPIRCIEHGVQYRDRSAGVRHLTNPFLHPNPKNDAHRQETLRRRWVRDHPGQDSYAVDGEPLGFGAAALLKEDGARDGQEPVDPETLPASNGSADAAPQRFIGRRNIGSLLDSPPLGGDGGDGETDPDEDELEVPVPRQSLPGSLVVEDEDMRVRFQGVQLANETLFLFHFVQTSWGEYLDPERNFEQNLSDFLNDVVLDYFRLHGLEPGIVVTPREEEREQARA